MLYILGAIPISRWWTSNALRFPIWIDSVQCAGNESSLLNCTHSAIGDISTFCDHYDDVGVRCFGEWNACVCKVVPPIIVNFPF